MTIGSKKTPLIAKAAEELVVLSEQLKVRRIRRPLSASNFAQ